MGKHSATDQQKERNTFKASAIHILRAFIWNDETNDSEAVLIGRDLYNPVPAVASFYIMR